MAADAFSHSLIFRVGLGVVLTAMMQDSEISDEP